ncbi:MAG TPA: hypothetical protein VJ853_12530, partial [Thermoanaerobaculia bacterium]|nr:hypothetical protein [Thermoanaerobaculia bacterium]
NRASRAIVEELRRLQERIPALAAAAYGLACAISLSTLTIGPPHPGQLPGALLLRGLDARAPMRMMLLAIVLPFVAAFALTPFLRRFRANWVIAIGLWIAIVDPYDVAAVIFVPLVFAAAAFLARDVDFRFTRRDIILIPSGFALFASLSFLPVAISVPLAALVILGIRVVRPAESFAIAPAALLLDVHAWFPDWLGFVALAIVVLSPLFPQRWIVRRVTYPIFALALMASMSVLSAERAPRLDLFEDGHWLMPANEMLHGAKPYVDIVPGHGFINDGLLEYIVMRLGARTPGQILFVRHSLTMLLAPALYFIVLALTGSAEASVLTAIAAAAMQLTGTTIPGTVSVLESNAPIRTIPSMFALACCMFAVRKREPRFLAIAGVLSVLAFLTSVDFGVYSFVVLAVTILRFRRGFLHAIAGVTGAAILAALGMIPFLGAFLRVTFVETPKLTEAYALQFFYWPPQYEALLGVPDAFGGLFASRVVWIVVWVSIAIATAAMFASVWGPASAGRTAKVGPHTDAAIIAGTWVVLCAISFAERAHVVFMPVALAIIVAGIYALRRNRTAFAVAIVALATACMPTQFLIRAHHRLTSRAPLDPALVRFDATWMDARNAHRMAIAASVINPLPPGDTFFDFANMPGLYFVLNRHCPIRMYEVPFYETDDLQRETIAKLQSDSHVKLALMQFTNRDDIWIDNVPNPVRAPLVFAWLQQHFRPLLARDGVAIWIRR